MNNLLPEPTLRRLPWYLSRVRMLKKNGVENISSTALAKDLHLDPAVIAKDLSLLNIKGKTRIGYNITELEKTLNDCLDYGTPHKAIVMGVGSLGEALLHDRGLMNYGLQIVAGFDINQEIVDKEINGIPVYNTSEIESLSRIIKAEIGILTVPVNAAEEALEQLIRSGVKAIWNFTPMPLKVPKNIIVQNAAFYSPLAIIYNRLKN